MVPIACVQATPRPDPTLPNILMPGAFPKDLAGHQDLAQCACEVIVQTLAPLSLSHTQNGWIGAGGWTMDSKAANTDADPSLFPSKSGKGMQPSVVSCLAAAILAWIIGSISYLNLTATAAKLEAEIDRVQAARGIIEAP